jgi:hypothetical protein
MDLPEPRFESKLIVSRHKTETVQVAAGVMEGLLMVLLCHLNVLVSAAGVEGSMHHTGRNSENGEVIGRPYLR